MYRDKRFAIFLFSVGILSIVLIGYFGRDYYFLPLAEKYKSAYHGKLGPSGVWGHGLGVIGSFFMLLNFMYSWRKRYEFREKFGSLKTWLEFHMFVGLFGPTLIIYHSVFKFQNVIATISFVSMVIVVVTGIIGRYIYVQIPHNRYGAELDLKKMQEKEYKLTEILRIETQNDPGVMELCDKLCNFTFDKILNKFSLLFIIVKNDIQRIQQISMLAKKLRQNNISEDFIKRIVRTLNQRAALSRKIILWDSTHKLLDFWRVLHKKLSWVLFITLAVHVLVTMLFGFTWVF